MDTSIQPSISGQQLVADYQSVFMTIAMSETASYEATRSEQALLHELQSMSGNVLLNPDSIPGGAQGDIAHDSLDAHVKKVQADQMRQLQLQQVSQLITDDQARYHGKKVRLNVLDSKDKPIDSTWFDSQKGYHTGTTRLKQLTGIIEEVLLNKNALIVKPSWQKHLISPGLQYYTVYVIAPDSLQPMVSVTLL